MLTQFLTIGFLMLFSAMLPGPDFALVAKNTLLHSRRAGLLTSLGIGTAILVHITYCALGLAIIISESLLLFTIIKYIGAAYLIYLGIGSLLTKQTAHITAANTQIQKLDLSILTAFRQGFLCNLFNPKATLFFLALFTVIIKPDTPLMWELIYVIEMFVIITVWFCSLTFILSHPRVTQLLNKFEKYISKIVGIFLIGFGVALVFVNK